MTFPGRFIDFQNAISLNILQYLDSATRPADFNLVDFGMDVQDAIDVPAFHTTHAPSSFYPRDSHPRHLDLEGRVPAAVADELRARGHEVQVGPDWSLNYTTAITYDPARRLIEGGASSRGERCYAIGW